MIRPNINHGVQCNNNKNDISNNNNNNQTEHGAWCHHHHHVALVARISLTSLATRPYRSSPLAGRQDNILYPHIATECISVLVVLLFLGHVWGSLRVHLL